MEFEFDQKTGFFHTLSYHRIILHYYCTHYVLLSRLLQIAMKITHRNTLEIVHMYIYK